MPNRFSPFDLLAYANNFKLNYVNCVFELRTGGMPASPSNAPTGTLVGYVTKDGATYVGGQATTGTNGCNWGTATIIGELVEIPKDPAETWKLVVANPGTIGWGRMYASVGTAGGSSYSAYRFDFDVGVTSGVMRMAKTTYVAAETGVIQAAKLTFANFANAPI